MFIISSITKLYLDEINSLKSQIRTINQDILSLESKLKQHKNRKKLLEEKIIFLNQNLQSLKEAKLLLKND